MKITETKLRKMIREVLREFTSSAKSVGTRTKLKRGTDSDTTKTKRSAYDSAKASEKFAQTTMDKRHIDYKTAEKAFSNQKGKNWSSTYSLPDPKKKYPTRYASGIAKPTIKPGKGYGAWTENPEYARAELRYKTSQTNYNNAVSSWNASKEATKDADSGLKSSIEQDKRDWETPSPSAKDPKPPKGGIGGRGATGGRGAKGGAKSGGLKSKGKGKGKGKGKKGGKDDE